MQFVNFLLCVTVARHFIQIGNVQVGGVKLQINPARQPEIRDSENQHSVGTSETAVPASSAVEVSWSGDGLVEDVLKMFLQNRKRSGGGPVKDLRFFADECKAYVRFVDSECKLLLQGCVCWGGRLGGFDPLHIYSD